MRLVSRRTVKHVRHGPNAVLRAIHNLKHPPQPTRHSNRSAHGTPTAGGTARWRLAERLDAISRRSIPTAIEEARVSHLVENEHLLCSLFQLI